MGWEQHDASWATATCHDAAILGPEEEDRLDQRDQGRLWEDVEALRTPLEPPDVG